MAKPDKPHGGHCAGCAEVRRDLDAARLLVRDLAELLLPRGRKPLMVCASCGRYATVIYPTGRPWPDDFARVCDACAPKDREHLPVERADFARRLNAIEV